MHHTIDLHRLECGEADGDRYTAEEIANAIATVGAMMTLACPFSGRGTIFRETAELMERTSV